MPKYEKRFRYLWCCNPFGLEGHSRKIGKGKITEGMRENLPHLVLGAAICTPCRIRIYKKTSADKSGQSVAKNSSEEECVTGIDEESRKRSGDEYVATEAQEEVTISNLNKLLTTLGHSPVSKRKFARTRCYAVRKASAVAKTVKELIFNVPNKSDDGKQMIAQFKDKFSSAAAAREKYMILTCLPKSWSENKIMTEFGVSLYVL